MRRSERNLLSFGLIKEYISKILNIKKSNI